MKLIYQVDDKPKFGALVVFALQQLLAIMTATLVVPIIINNNTDVIDKFGEGSIGMSSAAALFGAGVGTMEGICGALSGAVMIAGLKNSTANLEKPDSKASTIKISKQLITNFKDRVGSITCREIKGNNSENKVLCSCDDCIKHGVKLVEEFVM